jgi:hypothetical protein
MNDPERRAWAMDQFKKPDCETLVFEAIQETRVSTDRGPGSIRRACRTKDAGGRIVGPVMVEIRLDCSSDGHDILIYRRREDYHLEDGGLHTAKEAS